VSDFEFDAALWRTQGGGPLSHEHSVFSEDGRVKDGGGEGGSDAWCKKYRYTFGPKFGHAGVYTLRDDCSYGSAVERLTSKRKPRETGLHEQLIANQSLFYQSSILIEWRDCLRQRVADNFHSIDSDVWQNIRIDSEKAHVKAKLRRSEFIKADNTMPGDLDGVLSKRVVTYQFKDGECLDASKKSRGTCNLGTMASLIGGYLMDHVKAAYSLPYRFRGATAVFISSPTGPDLVDAFARILTPTEDIEFIYYSDDSCIAIKCDDDGVSRYWRANLDISSCDASNFAPVFGATRHIMGGDSRFAHCIKAVFDQLMWSLTFITPSGLKQTLKPTSPRLYSGSVLTTVVNNTANMSIFLSISDEYYKYADEYGTAIPYDMIESVVKRAAGAAGYIITCDECIANEDIQFLKRSASIIDGVIHPWLNLGVWLRGFGSIEGDLGGSSNIPLAERAALHNKGVVEGHKCDGEHIISQAFREMVADTSTTEAIMTDYHGGVGATNSFIDTDYLSIRYRLSPIELIDLASWIRTARLGQLMASPVVDKIMLIDYGFMWGDGSVSTEEIMTPV